MRRCKVVNARKNARRFSSSLPSTAAKSATLSPTTMRENGQAPFTCDVVSTESLGDMKPELLESYAAVLLNDPRPLSAPAWQRLHAYAFGGGGIPVAREYLSRWGVRAQDAARDIRANADPETGKEQARSIAKDPGGAEQPPPPPIST